MIILSMYIAIFAVAYFIVSYIQRGNENKGFNSLKTVTFGDESAVVPNRAAAFISVITIFLIWGAFTDSKLVPFHVPGQ
jgi:taurine transport system permease protein